MIDRANFFTASQEACETNQGLPGKQLSRRPWTNSSREQNNAAVFAIPKLAEETPQSSHSQKSLRLAPYLRHKRKNRYSE